MKNLLIAIVTAFLLCACSTSRIATNQGGNIALKQTGKMDVVSEQAVEHVRKTLAKAEVDGLPYYTPLHFQDAQKSLKKVALLQQNSLSLEGEDINVTIMNKVFKIEDLVTEGYQLKTLIMDTLSESLKQKIVLDSLDCKKILPKAYSGINKELIALFKLIEKNKIEKAHKAEIGLLADMVDLEIDALIKIYMAPAKAILVKAEGYGADDYAEKTYDNAESAIEQGEEFIKVNYRDLNEIKKVAAEALLAAKKALNTGKLSKSMVELGEKEAELKALEMEDLLNIIIQGYSANNLQGLTLQQQAQELAKLARSQTNKIKELTTSLSANEAH